MGSCETTRGDIVKYIADGVERVSMPTYRESMLEQKELILLIIQQLEYIRLRPALWLGLSLEEAEGFIKGFNTAWRIVGLWHGCDETYQAIAVERGWEWLVDAGALPSMQERGLDKDAIIQELINIEIEAWKRRYSLE